VFGGPRFARRVREVAQEALALVEDLLRRQRKLAGLRDRATDDRDLRLFPQQQVVQRGQVLQRAHGRGHDLPVLEPDSRRVAVPRDRRSTHDRATADIARSR
jgi:hypothetical protein